MHIRLRRGCLSALLSRALGGCASILILFFSFGLPVFAHDPAENDLLDRGLGLILDTPDDLVNIPRTPEYRAFLPDRVDLSDWFPTPGAQGRQNSCVGWAVGYAARAYYVKKIESRNLSDLANIPSPAYICNSIRETSKECLSGAKISNALNLLTRGSASLKQVPYSPEVCLRPSEAIQLLASDFRISRWLLLDPKNPDQIKGALSHGNPVIISFRTTKAFLRLKSGEIYRNPDQFVGYHAITLVGYDERRQAFKLINSWGRRWGDGGFGWVDYDTLRSEAREAYLMRVDVGPSPQPPSAVVTLVPAPVPKPTPPSVVAPTPLPVQLPSAVVTPTPRPTPPTFVAPSPSPVQPPSAVEDGPKFNVTPPFGREMLIVLAGRSPIFSDLRPTQETERQFLTALRRALIAKPDPPSPDRDVSAGFDAIVTVEGRNQ